MFRLWGKIFKDARLVKDITIEDDSDDTRTHKIFRALDQICHAFDLASPIWLDSSVRYFKQHDRVRFTRDNFIEKIDFDYLVIGVLEED